MQLPRADASEREAFFVPSPDQLDRLADKLRALEPGQSTSADACRFDGEWSCRCLRTDGITVESWQPSQSRNIIAELDGTRFYLTRFNPVSTSFEGLTVIGAGGVMSATSGRLVDGAWILEDLTFSSSVPELSAITCASPPPERRTSATASRASQTESGFELSDYRVGPLPVGDVAPGERESGLLPPTVRAAPDAVEIEAATYFAPIAAATLTAAPGDWYGAGVRIFEDGALDLQARYDTEEGVVPFAWGSAGIGTSRQRIDATLEHPALARHAALRQLESGTFLRSWRRSALGINLSGPSYGFAVEGGWVSRPDGTSDGDLAASFGGRSNLGDRVQLDFDLQQYSRALENSSTHSSTASMRVATPLGDRTSAWLTPGVGAYANYGVIPAELGFEASASGGFFVDLDAGASWTGRFPTFAHRISPHVRAGRELAGISQRAPLPDDAPEFLFSRVPQFGWAVVELDNTFEFENWDLALPAGTAGLGDEVSDLVPLRPYFAPRLTFADTRLEAGVSCATQCSSVGSMVAVAGGWSNLDGAVTLVDGSVDDMRLLSGARGFASPITFLLRSNEVTELSQRWGHASIGWSLSSLRLRAEAVATPGEFVGTTASATWAFEPLGFGLTALGGWRHTDEVWSAMFGFSI